MELHWHVIHVSSRTEKKVAERLEKKGFLVYLPIQKQLRQWSDRKKWVDMILVSGYVFVKTNAQQHINVLETNGVSRFLRHAGKPVIISETEMTNFQNFISRAENRPVEFTPEHLPIGSAVTIEYGHFKGLSGEIVQYKGKRKLIVHLTNFGNCSLELSPADISPKA
ncbi:MAG: UpxY family transcription antiterminator [Bacteroidales bacterium]|jgi:transcription antitermination factor NusG|nr:UpxY family transcription antiterminator [Bacteroidales bacterium]